MNREELLEDIESTMNQLLENAKALESIKNNPLFTTEQAYLEKTQESLLAHLLVVQGHVDDKPLIAQTSRKKMRCAHKKNATTAQNGKTRKSTRKSYVSLKRK